MNTPKKKKIAGIVTVYFRGTHADVLLGKVLDGYLQDGGAGPNLQLVSLYADQHPKGDLCPELAKKHGFKLCDSIEQALTLGGKGLAVDGVIIVGEHGNYPDNAKQQTLFPRRRFFEEVTKVFAKCGKSIPVFNDKHLAASWEDAKWMYDRARELYVPFMAGSSMPLMWRNPPVTLPMKCDLTEAVVLAYGGYDAYGFHALEALQAMAERRKGGEVGVRAVQNVATHEMWKALDAGRWSKRCLDAAMGVVTAHHKGDVRALTEKQDSNGVMLIEYRDGLRAAVPMLNGWALDGAFAFAGHIKGQDKLVATNYVAQENRPQAHFAYLLRAIDSMMQTGHAAYPVERTLLTTGILDAIMTSRAEKGRRIETPHLAIKYQPVDWPFATDPIPPDRKD
jgi:hypothetical protein